MTRYRCFSWIKLRRHHPMQKSGLEGTNDKSSRQFKTDKLKTLFLVSLFKNSRKNTLTPFFSAFIIRNVLGLLRLPLLNWEEIILRYRMFFWTHSSASRNAFQWMLNLSCRVKSQLKKLQVLWIIIENKFAFRTVWNLNLTVKIYLLKKYILYIELGFLLSFRI